MGRMAHRDRVHTLTLSPKFEINTSPATRVAASPTISLSSPSTGVNSGISDLDSLDSIRSRSLRVNYFVIVDPPMFHSTLFHWCSHCEWRAEAPICRHAAATFPIRGGSAPAADRLHGDCTSLLPISADSRIKQENAEGADKARMEAGIQPIHSRCDPKGAVQPISQARAFAISAASHSISFELEPSLRP